MCRFGSVFVKVHFVFFMCFLLPRITLVLLVLLGLVLSVVSHEINWEELF